VAKYNLKERQECDVEKCPNAQKIIQQKKNEQEKKRIIEEKQDKVAEKKKFQEKAEREQSALSKKAFDNCLNRDSKRHKSEDVSVCVSAELASSCVLDTEASQNSLRVLELKRQKQWHLEQSKEVGVQKNEQKNKRKSDSCSNMLQVSAHGTCDADLRREHARQCAQRRKLDIREHRNVKRCGKVLVSFFKRVLARQSYTNMLLNQD